MGNKYKVSYTVFLGKRKEEYFEVETFAEWLVEELEKQFPFVKNVTLETVKS